MDHAAVAIIPAADLDASAVFWARLGFAVVADYPHHGYRILEDARGASVHLTRVPVDAVEPGRSAYGVYLYSAEVATLAAASGTAAEAKPWGLVEFAVVDPSGTLVRVGWPVGEADAPADRHAEPRSA